MTNFHTRKIEVGNDQGWQPVPPPKRNRERTEFHARMIMPGLSIAFHTVTLGRSRTSVAAYRASAIEAAKADPAILEAVQAQVTAMTPERGLHMAQMRGSAQLPFWSRLAISEYRKRGFSRSEIAAAFRCSLGTVANVLQGKGRAYGALSAERRLSHSQCAPPGQWRHRQSARTI
jgi:hypothetical protein